jgi:Flp pilus assembly protein TadD
MGDDISAMLGKLQSSPDDHALRARAANALDAEGRGDEALALLATLVNVTGHDDDAGLPCLCKRCLPQAPASAESSGMAFQRTFAVARDRVLHFWMLAELAHDRAQLRGAVASALAIRLAPKRKQ